MRKFFTFLVLLVLTSVLANHASAQNRAIYKPTIETIDFTGYGGAGNPNNVQFGWSNNHPMINNQVISERLTVQNQQWALYGSDTYNETYLQKRSTGDNTATLSDLKAGDVVTIWGECGNQDGGDYYISGSVELINTTYFDFNGKTYPNSKEYRITNPGDVQIVCHNDYSGIRKITIQSQERETPHFDYDPGFEDYDMYDEFSENDPKKVATTDEENESWGRPYTSYTLSSEETGITFNENTAAQYIVLSNSKITANNRIAIDASAGDWRFNYGLRAPDEGVWANFSICNLREGDRVVFSYTGTAPVFSSVAGGTEAPTGPYNGSNAFFDYANDGTFDEGEDYYITPGATPVTDWSRDEGNFYKEDHNGSNGNYELIYTRYVITEDGHLDLAIAPDTRIVHIKIYSDHQASMVDEYSRDSYKARFDITGELQANEHIVPGGLEVHVGSSDPSQHAHVVSSPSGPVAIVNAVDGFKLPGMSRDENGNLQFQFHLENNIPQTGTFYKFMPLENGQMSLTFQAASMNYYSYALNGDETYYGHTTTYNDQNDWSVQFDRPNEQTVDVTCPYYLVKVEENGRTTFTKLNDFTNGYEYTIPPFEVQAGETYYLYGGWNNTNVYFNGSGQGQNNLEYFPFGPGNGGKQNACGVAKLLEIVFNPEKKIYPLAKWVPNGTTAVNTDNPAPNPDTFVRNEIELADLWGYGPGTKITVKKMAGNITQCHPYLVDVTGQGEHNHRKLMIDQIEFAGDKDQGGTILIKIGEPDVKSNPVYTLTIAYSGNPDFDGNSGTGTRGHIWDFSSKSLDGLEWNPNRPANTPQANPQGVFTNDLSNTSKYAKTKDYGHYFANYFGADISQYSSKDEVFSSLQTSGSGLLYEEISGDNSDWMFNYNRVNAGKLYDPIFTNKYDLEADNADLIWDTEGTVFKTSANGSMMFNEFTGQDIHESTYDPDRFVGIVEGGQFRIPWLMPNDRVIIYMGTGKGAFNDQAVFNIRGAYDALHNEIDSLDAYIVGGSHWNYYTYLDEQDEEVVNDDPYYRGCYHFFAQGHNGGPADMVFKMVGGSMCKIYSIQIYRGDRIITNEIVGETADDNKYFLWSRAADPNDNTTANYLDETRYNWKLNYLGKEQQLANGTGKNSQDNEIIAKTGKYSSETPALTDNHEDAEDETSKVVSFTYTHELGEIGTFRMRGKDMEKNMNYVADYADHNVTIAYQQTQTYPYTWDFTDVTGIEENVTSLFAPEEQLGEETTPPSGISADDWANSTESYQRTARDLSLWEVSGTSGNYFLRLNSQTSQTLQNLMERDNIFETAKEIGGNQVWANKTIVPEMQGLWLYTDDNNQGNGQWIIKQGDANNVGGLEFIGTDQYFKKIVVPNVPKDAAVYLRMTPTINGAVIKYKFGEGEFAEIVDDGVTKRFYSVDNDYIVALLNPADGKSNLTLTLNGYRIQKLAVSIDPKTVNKYGWATESRERVIDPELTSFLTGYDIESCPVTEIDYGQRTVSLTRKVGSDNIVDKYVMAASSTTEKDSHAYILHHTEDVPVEILNGGFHLFVPDMHDYNGTQNALKTVYDFLNSKMKAQLAEGIVAQTENGMTNYVLTWQYVRYDKDGNLIDLNGDPLDEDEVYKDYGYVGFFMVQPGGVASRGHQGYLPIDTSAGVNNFTLMYNDNVTDIDSPMNVNPSIIDNVYYNLNGQKLNGVPTQSGLYIVNGKKVMVK